MKVLRHNHVSDNDELIFFSHLFQRPEKKVAPIDGSEQCLTTITTASDEMQLVVAVIAREIPGHVR